MSSLSECVGGQYFLLNLIEFYFLLAPFGIFLCSLLFCSVFMGICVWGVQLHWLQADTYGPSGVIQETIGRHEDGQGWGRANLENVPTDHDNVAGWEFFGLKKNFFFTYILIVCIPFSRTS